VDGDVGFTGGINIANPAAAGRRRRRLARRHGARRRSRRARTHPRHAVRLATAGGEPIGAGRARAITDTSSTPEARVIGEGYLKMRRSRAYVHQRPSRQENCLTRNAPYRPVETRALTRAATGVLTCA
jgi:hypothetical protein